MRKPPNHLAGSISPYLLEHADNPVEWYPWGPEALERARRENKLIFLSIGYSSCHWCHVMERHVFQNEEIAEMLRRDFISIKVDREERPDIDAQYMLASQLITGGGGWPLSAFLLPDRRPFFAAGRYFPPEQFTALIERIAEIWKTDPDALRADAENVAGRIREIAQARSDGFVGTAILDRAVDSMGTRFDERAGGFGAMPKFPSVPNLWPLLARADRDETAAHMLHLTLSRMARGGIHDHVGGGFFRYSVDDKWLIPHFEKMLYDQGQLAAIYAEAYALKPDPDYRAAALGIVRFVAREMTTAEGGFASGLDADSEGEEGKFYVFTEGEVRRAAGRRAEAFLAAYGVSRGGNFEGKNHLSLVEPSRPVGAFEPELSALFELRAGRVRPHTDDKVLAAWNGLMIDGLARVAMRFGDEEARGMAARAADFVLAKMAPEGRLHRNYRRGKLGGEASLSDYAYLADGLLTLAEAGEERFAPAAERLARTMIEIFWDPESGGFFDHPERDDHLARLKTAEDNAEPSAIGVAARVLLRLAERTGDPEWRARAAATVRASAGLVERNPGFYPTLALVADRLGTGGGEVTVAAEGEQIVMRIPEGWHVAVAGSDSGVVPLSIRADAPEGWTVDPSYPPGDVYAGTVKVPLRITPRPGAHSGDRTFGVTVRYQACGDAACLPPQTVSLTVTARVP